MPKFVPTRQTRAFFWVSPDILYLTPCVVSGLETLGSWLLEPNQMTPRVLDQMAFGKGSIKMPAPAAAQARKSQHRPRGPTVFFLPRRHTATHNEYLLPRINMLQLTLPGRSGLGTSRGADASRNAVITNVRRFAPFSSLPPRSSRLFCFHPRTIYCSRSSDARRNAGGHTAPAQLASAEAECRGAHQGEE